MPSFWQVAPAGAELHYATESPVSVSAPNLCPNCGRPLSEAAPICECGYSFYPRAAKRPFPSLKEMTHEEKQEMRAKAGRFLGILSIPAAMGGPYGTFAAMTAIVLAASAIRSPSYRIARVGLACAAIGFLLSIVVIVMLFGPWKMLVPDG